MKLRLRASATIISSIALVLGARPAHAQAGGLYRFSLVPEQSALNATLSATSSTAGTLIGNHNAVSNPTGTRTKPGILGSFGAKENLPVIVQDLSVAAEGPVATQASGTFDLDCDATAGTVSLSGLSVQALAAGSISIPFSVSLLTEAFRTRNPTATYPSIPLEIPAGSAVVTELGFVQAGPAVGTLASIDGVSFDLVVTVPVTLRLTANVLSQVIQVSNGPMMPLALSGVVAFNGDLATFVGSTQLQFTQTQAPAAPIPPFNLPLPTVDPNVDANVIASLVLAEVGVSLFGTLAPTAGGQRVAPPCPADFDGDGSVGGPDLAAVLAAWGPCQAGCAGDLNGDAAVDAADLAALLASWGICP